MPRLIYIYRDRPGLLDIYLRTPKGHFILAINYHSTARFGWDTRWSPFRIWLTQRGITFGWEPNEDPDDIHF